MQRPVGQRKDIWSNWQKRRHSHQSIHPGSHGEDKNGIKAGEQGSLGREDGGEVAGKRKTRHVCHQHRHCADLATGSEHHSSLSLRVFKSSVAIFLMIYFTKGSYCSKSSTCKSCPFPALALSLAVVASEVRPALPISGLSFLLSERTQLLLFTSYIVKM